MLQTGQAEGITEGARFDIFTEKDTSDSPLYNLEVEEVGYETSTFIKPEPPVYRFLRGDSKRPREVWALMTRVGITSDVAIYLPREQDFEPIRTEVSRHQHQSKHKRKITPVNKNNSHELAAFKDANGMVGYEITDSTCVQKDLVRLLHSTPLTPTTVYPVLSAAADFFLPLRRSSKERVLAGKITVSVYMLATGYIQGNKVLKHDGQDLNDMGTVLIKIGKNVKTKYGLELKSKHDQPLYTSVFMFNMSDLSICRSSPSAYIKRVYAMI
jgi:hypothetical protein